MLSVSRSAAARFFSPRVVAAALLLPAVSCTALKPRLPHAADTRGVGAALTAVQTKWQQLPAGRAASTAESTQWRASLGGLLRALELRAAPRTWTGTQSIDGWHVTFAGDTKARLSIPPSTCERITPAVPPHPLMPAALHPQGDGAGLPVIMLQRRTARAADPFLPPNGRHLPATLTADFHGNRKVALTFHHTRNVHAARVRGAVRPLASDVPAAVSRAMDRRFLRKFALRGLIQPDHHLKDAGIYALEPFDPEKIPVVFVHGFESAPHIWGQAVKAMAADPELRRRYQAWYFLYPSGLSIHSAAAHLRLSLQKARDFYDPGRRSPAMKRMVITGHSMGGLLARMQVIDSGSELYGAFFTVPLERLPLSRENREHVKSTLSFRRLPFVKRVVFIATPHRGSDVAELSVIRLVSRLFRPAKLISGLFREMSSVASFAVNPKLRRFRDLGSRSTEGLSPNHPLLAALHMRPVQVPFHNIIPVWKPMSLRKTIEESTDGVVSYQSAWLPGSESTTVIQSFHTCAKKPAATKELLRILHLHAAPP